MGSVPVVDQGMMWEEGGGVSRFGYVADWQRTGRQRPADETGVEQRQPPGRRGQESRSGRYSEPYEREGVDERMRSCPCARP